MTEQTNKLLHQKRNWLLLAWPLAVIACLIARSGENAAESIFAKGIYRVYGTAFSFVSGLFPFSLAELIVIAVPILSLVWLVYGIAGIVRSGGERMYRTLKMVRTFLIVTGIVFFWYMIGCGTNYYRHEFAYYSGYEVKKSTTEELYELCETLAVKTAQARTETGTPETEVFASSVTDRELAGEAVKAMKKLGGRYDILSGYFPKPKSVLFSRFMSEFNITGVYFPWTVEANVNVDVPDYSVGATMCHELSHLRGFMREDEANFIGYLACADSDCPELRYSGYMLALIYSGNQLYAVSPDLYREVLTLYSEGMILDMQANSRYWDEFKDTVYSEVGEKVNDAYLKANNQTDGTRSYGRMVDLLLAEQRANKQ